MSLEGPENYVVWQYKYMYMVSMQRSVPVYTYYLSS